MSAIILDFTLAKARVTFLRSRSLLAEYRVLLDKFRAAEVKRG